MRHVPPDEEKLARAIAEHHVPALVRAQFDALPSGEGNRAYLLNGGPRYRFIVRLVEDLRIHKLRDEIASIEMLTKAGLPVPELVAHDLDKTHFPVLYRIVRFIEGYDFEEGISTGRVPEEEEQNLARSFGELMARFHSIRGAHLLKPGTTDQPVRESWVEFLRVLGAKHMKLARERELLDRTGEKALAALLEREFAALDPNLGGELTHRDLHLANVIIDEGGIGYRLAGLIDLEHTRCWDRLWDFAKLKWLVFDRHPSLAEPFLQAYRAVLPEPVDFERRTHLYRALEALVSITFFAPLDPTKTAFFKRALDAELSRSVP